MTDKMSSTNPDSSLDNAVKKQRDDFIFIKTIGEGSFSTVHLAEERKTGYQFAIKECDKHQIVKEKKVKYIHLEKRILAQYLVNHPFIIKLCFTFQDESSLYFGLSYCANGDLLEYIKKYETNFRYKNFAEFYSGEIVDAIEFMHSKNIIHRDLKPENILVDEWRHLKISDFGTARILDDDNPNEAQVETHLKQMKLYDEDNKQTEKSDESAEKGRLKRRNSFVGTAQYVSPEILQGKNVHKGCDLWALGCIIYQMFTGKHCFTGPHEYDIYQKIIRVNYDLPDIIPAKAKSLIQMLIQFEPHKRLGVDECGGFAKLKQHEFFGNLNWSNLSEQEPPSTVEVPVDQTKAQSVDKLNSQINLAYTSQLKTFLNNNNQFYRSNSNTLAHFQLINSNVYKLSKLERDYLLKEQEKENKYHKFAQNNLILKQGFLLKRKDFRARRRLFLLTDEPNLFYVEPENLILKGSIPWSLDLRCEIKNFQVFYIHTPKRKYYLIDEESQSLEWCKSIMNVKNIFFK